MEHKVRTQDGGTATVQDYTRGNAIALHCAECMGWEQSPRECTVTLCALYPYKKGRKRLKSDS